MSDDDVIEASDELGEPDGDDSHVKEDELEVEEDDAEDSEEPVAEDEGEDD